MAATVSEAVEFGWGPTLLERVLEGGTALLGAVQLAEAMTTRLADDGPGLDGESRIDLLRVWERLEAMVAGRKQLALAAVVDATAELGLLPEEARHEVGAALRLAPVTASDRTRVAIDLRDRLPATLSLLCHGEIGWRQAANVADGVRYVPDEVAAAVEQRVLARLPRQTAAETRRSVADAVVAVDPAGAADRAEQARAKRRIERLTQPDSMASWWFAVPADVEHAMWTSATSQAKAVQAARRAAGLADPGLDALRVDVVVDAVLAAGQTTPAGRGDALRDAPRCSCGGAQEAAVIIDLPTLLGLADNPGQIPGYGAVPGPIARRMAADRDWVRWTVDPGTRQVIDRGRDTYRPSARMRAFLAARDRVCGFPGCNRRAQDCECDHVVNHGLPNGETIAVNLGPLCRQHHNAKTHGRWRLRYEPPTGLRTWRSPLGKTYLKGTDPPLA